MNKKHIFVFIAVIVLIAGFCIYSRSNSGDTVFKKKQECSQYTELANKKITKSGRVFEKDTFTLNEIFYSPKMDSCLYAYTIHTTFDPKEIYTIDDLFGGSVYVGGIATDAEKSFYQKIEELKK